MSSAETHDRALPGAEPDRSPRLSLISWLALAVAPLAILSLLVTGAVIIGFPPLHVTDRLVLGLELLDLLLGLSLAGLIALRWLRLWNERRRGAPGSRLHFRLVALFSAIAVVPAVLVATYAVVTLNIGIDTWFSVPVRAALDDAVYFARHYVSEQGQGIIYDAGTMADALQLDRSLRDANGQMNKVRLFEKLSSMTQARSLPGSFLIDGHGNLLGSATRLQFTKAIAPSATDLAQAAQGQIVVDGSQETGVIRALIHLPVFNDADLLVVRLVDPKVFAFYQRQKVAVSQYHRFESERARLELTFAALYVVVSFVLLLAAIWLGLWASNRIVRPVSRLIGAADQVSRGDLRAQVAIEKGEDDIATLARAFNRMVSQLEAQRAELMDANLQIDERRRFTETVLGGVSAGVLGLAADGHVTIVNRTAARLLDAAPETLEKRHFSRVVPEFSDLIRRAISDTSGRASGEVTIKRAASARTLSVQVASERGQASGYVVTFDDITELVSAQRTAAWADVARRIAHEIKNPLTPIQLSAERLKRKYAKEVSSDSEIFEQCTDTIIRQVGDIGRMVDEFSSFARMPTPVMTRAIAQELVQQAIFLQRVAYPQIQFETKLPKQPLIFEGDGRLLSQALTNVLKNASESIAARLLKSGGDPGTIIVSAESTESQLVIRISDNGLGLPAELRDRLTEPYVTTRAKGTGLGLAIVRKILEDHRGELSIADTGNGAEVMLKLPLQQKIAREKDDNEQERLAHSG
ncbi:MAG: PAS domain-containing sensor histidine kinase [Alphaproteobacteria bacterium]|nr:PAS domain-containing sensor histidine kinase [Alphaproteobacteria bacterium]